MGRRRPSCAITEGLRDHPAVIAARGVGFTGEPTRLEVLKEHPKTRVCRLHGVAGSGGPSVIAKSVRRDTQSVERTLYEKVLPRLTVDSLRYYGSAEDAAGDTVWMFFEDAGENAFSFAARADRALFTAWLGKLHAAALPPDTRGLLPERGPEHFLVQLVKASENIAGSLGRTGFHEDEVRLLKEVLALLQAVRSLWGEVERLDRQLPRTIVHGDLVPKNLRVLERGPAPRLVVLDWETAGWGAPCLDMASFFERIPEPELGLYLRALGDARRDIGAERLRRMSRLGALLRYLAAISWESSSLPWGRKERTARRMETYRVNLLAGLRAIQAGTA